MKILRVIIIIVLIGIILWKPIIKRLIITLTPTLIRLNDLEENQRELVKKAWRDMADRYPLIKKLQCGLYSLPYTEVDNDIYGVTKPSQLSFNIRYNSYILTEQDGRIWEDYYLSYYDFTVHELMHTVTKIFLPSFKVSGIITTSSDNSNTLNEFKENINIFINNIKEKHSISDNDILIFLGENAVDPNETLSDCMWLYLCFERDSELKKRHPESYRIAKIFISEFDLEYRKVSD